MEQEELVKRASTFRRTAKRLFNTLDGKKVLAYLKDSYIDNTALSSDTNQTMYKLGQKEFVQGLVRLINEPDELEEIIVKQLYKDE